jgi:hypothetical protein
MRYKWETVSPTYFTYEDDDEENDYFAASVENDGDGGVIVVFRDLSVAAAKRMVRDAIAAKPTTTGQGDASGEREKVSPVLFVPCSACRATAGRMCRTYTGPNSLRGYATERPHASRFRDAEANLVRKLNATPTTKGAQLPPTGER